METTISDLDTDYALSDEDIARYRNDGFVKLKNVLLPETVEAFEPAITSKVIELNTQHLPMEERDTYQRAFLQVENLWRHSETVRRFVFSRRLAQIAAKLMEVRAVRIFHDQALYKEAGGGITPWHADQYYWPVSSDRSITVWAPLQPIPMEMGPLAFSRGSHKFSYGRDLEISEESEAAMKNALAEQNFSTEQSPYELGEVSYHSGWTFHRASPNTTQVPRRVMTVIYVDADIRATAPTNRYQEIDLRDAMGGVPVGSTLTAGTNPVLYGEE